jgi:hypothetical protein
MRWFFIALFVFGIYFTIFGFRVVFQPGYVEKLRMGIWKPSETSKKLFPGKSGYHYDKYTTGIGCLVVGLMFLGFSIYVLFIN